ncbi:MAG: anaerobic sulfatase maturase [Defluviitaleaceae bacterium]|nr:anaerobic sulfatase maturase [Defluviitaleaceae bacterium]
MCCVYCFYTDIASARAGGSHDVMSLNTLEKVVSSALEEAELRCSFAFQGGEPLLAGPDFFRAFIKFVKKHNKRGVRTQYSIQTNGTLLDSEWAAFLSDNKFLVGLSIDGERSVHDSFRKDLPGKGTHSRCLAAARLLEKHNADFNILSVVTKQLASHPDKAWNFYMKHGFQYIQFIPCIESFDRDRGGRFYSLSAKLYGHFLCRVFDLWYDNFRRGVCTSVRAFDNYIHILMGNPPENCAMAGICNAYALVEADGSVYPCDFYALDHYLLGSVHTSGFEAMLTGEAARRFVQPSSQVDAGCAICAFFRICRGGCRRDREVFQSKELSRNIYCESFKMFFAHALPRMKQIACSISGKYSNL